MDNKEDEVFIDNFEYNGKIYDVFMSLASLFALPLSEDKKVTLVIDEKQQDNE